MVKRFLIGIIILTVCSGALADTKVANDPSRIGVGARLLGMGKSFVGEADDISSIFLNPAGLTSLKNWQLTSMQGKFINEVNYLNFAAAAPTQYGNLGFAYLTSDLSFTSPAATTENIDGIRIIPSSTEGVSYKYGNSALLLSGAYNAQDLPVPYLNEIKNLSLGATFKIFMQTLEGPGISGGNASGYDADLGLKYFPYPYLRLGLVLQNIIPFSMGGKIHWGSGSDESLPSLFKFGSSLKILGENGLKTLGDQELSFNFDYDATPLRPLPSLAHLGLEWSPMDIFSLRVGIDQDYVGKGGGLLEAANNLTAGIGITYQGFRFDYAFHQYYALTENDTSYFSLSYGFFKKPPPPPPVKEKMKVTSPEDKLIAYVPEVLVSGEVLDPGIKKVTINEQEAPLKDSRFEVLLPLNLGKNPIQVLALDEQGLVRDSKKLRILRLESFKDVKDDYWARKPVCQLASQKILTGYPDGSFRPEGSINRAEFSAILVRVLNIPISQAVKDPFKDVKKTSWAANYVLAASKQGFMKGYPNKTFKPQGRITRGEGAAALARFEGLDLAQPVLEIPFPDLTSRHWATKPVNALKNAGFFKYLENLPFLPKRQLTRGEVAELISHTSLVSKKLTELLDFEKGY